MKIAIKMKITAMLALAALVMMLCACSNELLENENTSGDTADEKLSVEELCAVMTDQEIAQLDGYSNLKKLDLSGSTCYDAIVEYADAHPQVDVLYAVSLGKTTVTNKDEKIVLVKDSFDFATLSENIKYLPNLKEIMFEDIQLEASQLKKLSDSNPGISLNYSLTLFGKPVDVGVTELDLSAIQPTNVEEVLKKLPLMTALANVKLPDILDIKDVAKLQYANPNAFFDYTFSLFGKTLTTAESEVEFVKADIGNEGEQQIREALDILDNCERFVLDNCGIDYEILASIRDDYRGKTKVVWRVYYGTKNRYNSMTDDDTLRAVYNVTDDTCGPMKYCEDVVYMDIGHNEDLTDLSFIGYMPKMEVLIASGCAAKELPGFENCKKMVWLELCFCPNLENIESLQGCESLRFVNLSYTNVKTLDTLHDKPLERFLCLDPKVSAEQEAAFLEKHPEDKCLSIFHDQTQPYGYGWHYDDHGYTYSEYYKTVVREAFDYDYLQHIIATKGDNFD